MYHVITYCKLLSMVSLLLLQLDDNKLHELSTMENYGWGDLGPTADISCSDDMQCMDIFGINPFYIEKGELMN